MTVPSEISATPTTVRAAVRGTLRFFGSLKLAVALIVILAAVLAWATFQESAHGRDYAQWYVYHSSWFIGLLALLGVNILAATLLRFPWRKKFGFVVTHAGLLVLLAGSLQTFRGGVEGQLSFQEGEQSGRIVLMDHSEFEARWQGLPGQPPPGAFVFQPGPVDWPDAKSLDMGEISGVHLRVLKFYAHARTIENWVEDSFGQSGPALRFAFAGPDDAMVAEDWLAAEQFGAESYFGPTKFELQRATDGSMLDDFLAPPEDNGDPQGVLSLHYAGKMLRIPVGKNLGKKVAVGDHGPTVEITAYLPNARPGNSGRFVSAGEDPKNPMLELRVDMPGGKAPIRQIAFARLPFLNLDGIHGQNCPVKFWYHHPALRSESGIEFLQTPDGKLYCRVGSGGKYRPRGQVKEGDRVEIAGGFKVLVTKYLRSARQEVTFEPIEVASGEGGPDAATEVEVTAGGKTTRVWLKRNDENYGMHQVFTPQGQLTLSFAYETLPLGFTLTLLKFTHGLNPGGMGDASFSSSVLLTDQLQSIHERHEINMNEPLVHGRYTFYQSSFQESAEGKAASILTAAYDPGQFLKYLGSVMICLGTFLMFYVKVPLLRVVSQWIFRSRAATERDSATAAAATPREAGGNSPLDELTTSSYAQTRS
jgi:hypothetical protein